MTIGAAMRIERRAAGVLHLWRRLRCTTLLRAWRDRLERFLAARVES